MGGEAAVRTSPNLRDAFDRASFFLRRCAAFFSGLGSVGSLPAARPAAFHAISPAVAHPIS
jgi:hypothetical protein